MSCSVNNTRESLAGSPGNCASGWSRGASQAWQAKIATHCATRELRSANTRFRDDRPDLTRGADAHFVAARTLSGSAPAARAAKVDERLAALAPRLLQRRIDCQSRAASGCLGFARRDRRIHRVREQKA